MFNFLKNSKKFHCLKKENLSPSLLGEKEAMKTADMISVHEFTFRTEKNPSFPPRSLLSIFKPRRTCSRQVSCARTRPAAHLGDMAVTANEVSPIGAGS